MADLVADEPDRTPSSSSPATTTSPSSAACRKSIHRQASPCPTRTAGHALEEPPKRRAPTRRSRPMRMFQSMCRSLPVLNPRCGRQLQPGACRIATPARLTPSDSLLSQLLGTSSSAGVASSSSSRHRLTGTLFGYRDGRVSLSLQDNARCRPTLVVELALPTHALLRELGTHAGARIVLESEKHSSDNASDTDPAAGDVGAGVAGVGGASFRHHDDDGWVLEEPMWTMFCNGKRVGYAVRREPTEEDITVLETLWAVTMSGGVLPGRSDVDGPDGEMAYMRGSFEHTVGSRDSESLYMVGPPGGDGPELAIFFVRL
ncbi:hypothetical protein HU200_057729 [Digitaria exilis]|uniref:Protein MIZU-KUSSEI 1 n=1 Tax=Digitaria exilis TaxID=1010633 RepID=A0A835ANM5_9POAL|nr:hypothetical protein HU200_057729 [Digitaria exilis]